MKLVYISLIGCLNILFASCGKDEVVNSPEFEVTSYEVTTTVDTAGNEVKQVTFNFSGVLP